MIAHLNTKPNKFLKPEIPSLNLITANIYFRLEHLDSSRASLRSRRYSRAQGGKLEIPPAQKLNILSSPAAG